MSFLHRGGAHLSGIQLPCRDGLDLDGILDTDRFGNFLRGQSWSLVYLPCLPALYHVRMSSPSSVEQGAGQKPSTRHDISRTRSPPVWRGMHTYKVRVGYSTASPLLFARLQYHQSSIGGHPYHQRLAALLLYTTGTQPLLHRPRPEPLLDDLIFPHHHTVPLPLPPDLVLRSAYAQSVRVHGGKPRQ